MKKNKITDLKFDTKNFNIGSQQGNALLEKSISKFGFREASTIDKNGVLIGGNKRVAKAGELGFEDVEIIQADPTKVYALQYKDIDIDTPQGRELALALNQTAKANIVFDAELIEAEVGEAVCVEWGMPQSTKDIDYSILDDDDVEDQLKDMTNGVKKAIQIEFEAEHYEEAYALVKFWREREAYVGGMIMEHLKAEKGKL